MKCLLFIFIIGMISMQGFAAINTYHELISRTSSACNNRALFNEAFTNDVTRYKLQTSDEDKRGAADLAISLFLMNEYDKELNTMALATHNSLVSNILNNASIANDSWIKYAAGIELINGLNIDGNKTRSYDLTTNLIGRAISQIPRMESPNFWEGLMVFHNCSGATVLDVLRLNAAIELHEEGNYSQLSTYTNALPRPIYQYYMEEVE